MKKVWIVILSVIAISGTKALADDMIDMNKFSHLNKQLEEDIKVFGREHGAYELQRMQAYQSLLATDSSEGAYNHIVGVIDIKERTATDAFMHQFVLRKACLDSLVELESNTSKLKARVLSNQNVVICSNAKFLGSIEKHRLAYLEKSKAIASQESFEIANKVKIAYEKSLEQYGDIPSVKEMNEHFSERALYR